MVFVDNVVEAIVKALDAPDGECGEAFLISEPDQLSWRDVLRVLRDRRQRQVCVVDAPPEQALGPQALASSMRPIAALARIAFSPEFRAWRRRCLWTDPIGNLAAPVVGSLAGTPADAFSGRLASTRQSPTGSPRRRHREMVEFHDRSDAGRLRQGGPRLGYVGMVADRRHGVDARMGTPGATAVTDVQEAPAGVGPKVSIILPTYNRARFLPRGVCVDLVPDL